MALRVASDSQYGFDFINNDKNLSMDVGRYFQGVEAFANYVGENYNWTDDNFLLKTHTNDDYQNEPGIKWETPLGNALPPDEVDKINETEKNKAWNAFVEKEFEKTGLKESQKNEFKPSMTEKEFMKKVDQDEKLANEYGYNKLKIDNIYRVGCKMMTAKYAAEQLTGEKIDAIEANEKLMKEGIYADGNMLYFQEYAKAIETLTDNKFNIEYVSSTENLTFEKAMEIANSDEAYIIHIRYEGHSELVSEFNFKAFSQQGYINSVETTNSWKYTDDGRPPKPYERTNLYASEVKRWDIYKATTKNRMEYYYSQIYY